MPSAPVTLVWGKMRFEKRAHLGVVAGDRRLPRLRSCHARSTQRVTASKRRAARDECRPRRRRAVVAPTGNRGVSGDAQAPPWPVRAARRHRWRCGDGAGGAGGVVTQPAMDAISSAASSAMERRADGVAVARSLGGAGARGVHRLVDHGREAQDPRATRTTATAATGAEDAVQRGRRAETLGAFDESRKRTLMQNARHRQRERAGSARRNAGRLRPPSGRCRASCRPPFPGCVPLVYSKLSPGFSSGCWPTTPSPFTSCTLLLASVMIQCRLISCAGTCRCWSP